MALSLMSSSVAAGSAFIQAANLTAAALFLLAAVTPVEEPPQLPVLFSPAAHCGIGAIAHLPLVAGALPCRTPGAQIALGQAISVPSLSALFQAGVYIGCLSIAPSPTRPPQ